MTAPQGAGRTGMRTPAGRQDWIPGHSSPLGGGTEGSTEGGGSCLCQEHNPCTTASMTRPHGPFHERKRNQRPVSAYCVHRLS